jgi:hypothetical protein
MRNNDSGGLKKKIETYAIFDYPGILNFFQKIISTVFIKALNLKKFKISVFFVFLTYGLATILKFIAILKNKLPS